MSTSTLIESELFLSLPTREAHEAQAVRELAANFFHIDIRSRCDSFGEEKTNCAFSLAASRSTAGNDDSLVFSYQTRVAVTAEQDSLLREYARLFGHVERTLFADYREGKMRAS